MKALQPATNSPKTPTFSIVIPCYNEQKYIGILLENLCQQSLSPGQVIIADSNSTDQTVVEAMKFNGRLPIEIARTTTRTPGAARNAGAKLATMDYILFLDADCLPVGQKFLQRLQTNLGAKPVDFISGMFTSDGWHPLSYVFFWSINFLLLTGIGFGKNIPLIGGMMCVRRTAHNSVGGFDESSLLGEDVEYGRRLKKVHAAHRTLATLYVVHSNRRGRHEGHLRALLHSMPTEGRFWPLVHKRLKARGQDKKYGVF